MDFRLRFAIPFFTIESWKPQDARPNDLWPHGDLTFLDMNTPQMKKKFGDLRNLHCALKICQFSCVVYGRDPVQHTTLLLVRGTDSNYFKPDEPAEPEGDPITAYSRCSGLQDPRKSFITALHFRSKLALSHWLTLAKGLEGVVNDFVSIPARVVWRSCYNNKEETLHFALSWYAR